MNIEPSAAAQVVDRMTKSFQAPFALWRRVAQRWECEGNPREQADRAFSQWLSEVAALPSGQSRVRPVGNGELLVGVSLSEAPDSENAVVGRVPASADALAAQLAETAFTAEVAACQNSDQSQLLEGYADKLAGSFEELSFLRRLSHHIEFCDASRTLIDAAHNVLPSLCNLMAVEGLALLTASDDPGSQPCVDAVVTSTGSLAASEADWRNVVDSLVRERHGVIVKNIAPHGQHDAAAYSLPGIRSMVVAPVAKDGVVFGWLLGVNKRLPPTNPDSPSNSLGHDEIGSMEASLLQAAAVLLATHAANARLFREKESLIVEAIHTLVAVIETKDAYTCGHSDRVALVGRRLAEELGLSPRDCHDVYLSGLLHDIGKVGIADDVLHKPGALTAEEFAHVKRHPEIGWRLLQRLKPLGNLLPGVLHHHEAVDGSGYPHSLRGESIPLHARVLAVADAWDAMTSNRPYRTGLPYEKAEAILRQGAGKQWDAQVVDAFFAVREDVYQITTSWQDHLKQILESPAPKAPALGNGVAAFTSASLEPTFTTMPSIGR